MDPLVPTTESGENHVAEGFRYGGDTSRKGKMRWRRKSEERKGKRDTWAAGAAHGGQIARRRRIQCRRWEMCCFRKESELVSGCGRADLLLILWGFYFYFYFFPNTTVLHYQLARTILSFSITFCTSITHHIIISKV